MRPLRRDVGIAPSRRQFLLGSAAVGLTLPAWARSVHAAAPERLRLASVGVGGMGGADLGSLSSHPKLDVVALCDVDSRRLAEAGSRHPKAKLYSDYRVMLDEMHDGIDAVQVSTPDHTHAAAAMTAMNHGKHVYCQKPLTHDVYEARQLRLAAEKTGVVTQMGTQIHSHGAYRTAVKLVQSGAIGKVSEVHSWSSKTWGYEGAQPAPAKVPEFLDWNLWLGTAPQTEYAEGQYHPANWRRWYDFGCGTMGDMAIHILDPVFTALKLGTPHKIISQSSKPPGKSYGLQNETRFSISATDYTTDDFALTWYDGGRMPETKSWPEQLQKSLPDQGSVFIGEKGYVLIASRRQPIADPEFERGQARDRTSRRRRSLSLVRRCLLRGRTDDCTFRLRGAAYRVRSSRRFSKPFPPARACVGRGKHDREGFRSSAAIDQAHLSRRVRDQRLKLGLAGDLVGNCLGVQRHLDATPAIKDVRPSQKRWNSALLGLIVAAISELRTTSPNHDARSSRASP
jgi:predicted dehydrogenase